jgi:hypothetical protein
VPAAGAKHTSKSGVGVGAREVKSSNSRRLPTKRQKLDYLLSDLSLEDGSYFFNVGFNSSRQNLF